MKSSKKEWRRIIKEDWANAHTESDFFSQHKKEAQQLVSDALSASKADVIIEVKSGFGENLSECLSANKQVQHTIGFDSNTNCIEYCQETYSDPRMKWVHGDVCFLKEVLEKNHPELMEHPRKLIIMTNNNIGTEQEENNLQILKQMSEVAGQEGYVLLVNWNSENFGSALQHFYSKMPKIYGELKKGEFDFQKCTFSQHETGYKTKWYSIEQTESMVYKSGWDVLMMKSIDLGIVSIGRNLPKPIADLNQTISEDTLSNKDKSRKSSELEVQSYYDGESVKFYKGIWGGTDIHIGLYEGEHMKECKNRPEMIKVASERSRIEVFNQGKKYLGKGLWDEGLRMADFGSAYGGMAVYAIKIGVNFVSCVDISAKENFDCKKAIAENNQNLHISMPGERSFSDTGEFENSFHLVVSIDSFLHAGQCRNLAINEAARVLKPGGILCFTDIMMDDQIKDVSKLKPVLERLKLVDLSSIETYKRLAEEAGLEFLEFNDKSFCLEAHYSNILQELEERREELKIKSDFAENMKSGLRQWVENAKLGNIKWGYFAFRKL